MPDIIVQNLNKYFGDFHLLKDISFEISPGQRVGIIGINGAGKTTLFKILTGELDFDSGVVHASAKKIGILDQLPVYPSHMTVAEVLWQAFAHLEVMSTRMKELEKLMEVVHTKEVLDEYAQLQQRFELEHGYDAQVLYAKMTNGLKIPKEMQERTFMSLSGGEKTRVNLARTMLLGTEILLLDEPTNHLDLQSIEWLETYLETFKGAAIVISHDRYFLDKTTNVTIELEEGKSRCYNGSYTTYMEVKEQERQALEEAKKRQDKEIARLEFTVERMKGWGLGNKKVMKRAFSMEKRLNRIERIQVMRKQHKMKNKFSAASRTGDEVYYFDKVGIGYDSLLIEDFTALVLRGERIAILGENGCGKTTLLKTILGDRDAQRGKVVEGAGLRTGFLPQEITFDHPERTVLDTLLYTTNLPTADCRDRLGAYGFRGEDVFKTVGVLSGGEKTRLRLCVFMNDAINTLVLDEPTNHLDVLSREWLEDALDDFDVTMLFVSHDRYFINRFATRIWMVEDGRVTDFVGSYEEFVELRQRQEPTPKPKAEPVKPSEPKQEKKPQKGLSYNDKKRLRELELAVAKIEKELAFLETEADKHAADYEKLAQVLDAKEAAEISLLEHYEELDQYRE